MYIGTEHIVGCISTFITMFFVSFMSVDTFYTRKYASIVNDDISNENWT